MRYYEAQTLNENFLSNTLKNLKSYYSEEEVKDKRDLVSAENIKFLQNIFSEEKIILFGTKSNIFNKEKNLDDLDSNSIE